jgi:hypothetical protein
MNVATIAKPTNVLGEFSLVILGSLACSRPSPLAPRKPIEQIRLAMKPWFSSHEYGYWRSG